MTRYTLLAGGLLLVACQTTPLAQLPTSPNSNVNPPTVNTPIGPSSTGPKPGAMTIPSLTTTPVNTPANIPSITTTPNTMRVNVSQLAAIRHLRQHFKADPLPDFRLVDEDLLALAQDGELHVRIKIAFDGEASQNLMKTALDPTGLFHFDTAEVQTELELLNQPDKVIQAFIFELISPDDTVLDSLSEPFSQACGEQTVLLSRRPQASDATPPNFESLCADLPASPEKLEQS